MTLVIALAVSVIFAAICHVMAARRGRSSALWGLLGFCFGPIPILVLVLLGRTDNREMPAR